MQRSVLESLCCQYKSDMPQFLLCAVNPKGDCLTCEDYSANQGALMEEEKIRMQIEKVRNEPRTITSTDQSFLKEPVLPV